MLSTEFWPQILQDWHNYRQNLDTEPALLGRPSANRVYFTDAESIFVCKEAEDFGLRLSLGYSTKEGCAVIFFDTDGLSVDVPEKAETASRDGLTAGGAREWITGNLAIDFGSEKMEAFEVNENGQRSGPVN